MRSVFVLVLPLVLTGAALESCSVAPPDTRAAYEPVTDATGTATPLAQISPAAGDVVSVLQSRVGGVLTQRIVLRGDALTDGENQIVVKVDQNPGRQADLGGPVPKPSESLIQNELDESFPKVDMRMSLTSNHNSFGPFGYAIGHPPHGVTCIYAWQYSAGRLPRLIDSPGAAASARSMPSAPTSVRVRLCKSGMEEAEIVGLLRGLAVFPPGSSDPYFDPTFDAVGRNDAQDALSAAGAPGPDSRRAEANARGESAAPRTRRPRHLVAATAGARRTDAVGDGRGSAAPSAPIVNVPLPAASSAAPSSAEVNPLLAPLQGKVGPRSATAAADDMPLPGRSAAAPRAAAPAPSESRAVVAPVPMPN
jgi:hypothetical protein